jgi:hypothetical protein
MRATVVVGLVIASLVLAMVFWFTPAKTFRPMMMQYEYVPRPEKGKDVGPPEAPAPPPPKTFYQKAKEEISSVLDVGGKASPVVTMILAIWTAKKKKRKR